MDSYILVIDTGVYVNDQLPCLKKYKKNVCVIKLETKTDEIESGMECLDFSADKGKFDISKSGYESWQYQCIHSHAKEILSLLSGNVLILGDLNLDALYVLDLLEKSGYPDCIHLILPLPFGRLVKGTIQYELLSDLKRLKTLAVYDPYQLSIEKYGNTKVENVRNIINEQTGYLLKRYHALLKDMLVYYGYEKYFFDFEKDQYINTESLDILKVTGHGILGYERVYNWWDMNGENNIFIKNFQIPVPRPDGKLVCSQLRSIRKKFAQLNGIDYEFKECEYHGPCAGTCQMCDEEAKKLKKLAEQSGSIKYPEIQLEESL